jgi:hypothetical protein
MAFVFKFCKILEASQSILGLLGTAAPKDARNSTFNQLKSDMEVNGHERDE